MQAVLYLDLTNNSFYSFEKSFLSELKKSFPELLMLDLDAHSDPDLIRQAHQLLLDAEKAIIYYEGTSIPPRFLSFAELVIKNPEKYRVFLKGNNQPLIHLFYGISTEVFFQNESSEKEFTVARLFFKNEP